MNLPEHGDASAERSPALANRYAVLIVDDMRANRLLLKQLLRSVGYHTYEVDSGDAALDFLNQRMPDAIITDVEMPEMSGLELIGHIRRQGAEFSEIPILSATGNPTPGIEQDLYDAGADAYLTKPVDVTALISTIANLIRHGRPTDPREAAARLRTGDRQEVKVLANL